MAKPKGLGRGLDALFSDNIYSDASSGGTTTLKIYDIEPNKNQPRKIFDEELIAELASSISKHGLIQPIIVRPQNNGLYEIVAGERRWRACKIAGISDIPVIIKDFDDITTAQIALIENLQREDLNPVEEALGYQKLMDDYGFTQEELSENIGKSRSTIANLLRLLNLPQAILDMVANNELSSGHARTLLSILHDVTENELINLANTVIKNEISVRSLEKMIKNIKNNESNVNNKNNIVSKEYFVFLEKKVSEELGRKVKIGNKSLSISFSDNTDLETFIIKICGDNFFND